jgi:hypothetical protein
MEANGYDFFNLEAGQGGPYHKTAMGWWVQVIFATNFQIMKSSPMPRLLCLLLSGLAGNLLAQGVVTVKPANPGIPVLPVVQTLGDCLPPPVGLVGWWRAEGNGEDSIGTNQAEVPSGVTYVPAEVGLGFDLEGNTNRILVPDAPELNFGPNQDFSIEAWIQPLADPGNYTDPSGEIMTVVAKRYNPDLLTALGYEVFLAGGRLSFQMDDTLDVYHNFNAGPDLRDGRFHHVAVTVQRNSITGLQFYVDGQLIDTFDPTIVPGDLSNTEPLRIGNHPIPTLPAFYHGIIDEVSLYNRALSAAEIAAIYNAGSAGKCGEPLPPGIFTQPASQTVLQGGAATFSVATSGTGPLRFQWTFDGHILRGSTNASLSVSNLHPQQAGNYAVQIT